MVEQPKPQPQETEQSKEVKSAAEIVGYPMDNIMQLFEYCMQQSKKKYPGKEFIDRAVILLAEKDAENHRRLVKASKGILDTGILPELTDEEYKMAEEMYVKKLNELNAKFKEGLRWAGQTYTYPSKEAKWSFNQRKAELIREMAAELDGYMNHVVETVDALDADEDAVLVALAEPEEGAEETMVAEADEIYFEGARKGLTGKIGEERKKKYDKEIPGGL